MQTPPKIVPSQYPPITSCLKLKSFSTQYIVIGDEPLQLAWLEQKVGVASSRVSSVTDETLLGKGPCIYLIHKDSQIELSSDVRSVTKILASQPIKRGSAAQTALIKYAASLSDTPASALPKDYVALVASHLPSDEPTHLLALVWRCVDLLNGELFPTQLWPYPWNDSTKWLPRDVDPKHRLNALHKDITAYIFLKTNRKEEASRLGFSPAKLKFLSNLKLPVNILRETLIALSRWRMRHTDPYCTALEISSLWQ